MTTLLIPPRNLMTVEASYNNFYIHQFLQGRICMSTIPNTQVIKPLSLTKIAAFLSTWLRTDLLSNRSIFYLVTKATGKIDAES
jgi:hypothetical protein